MSPKRPPPPPPPGRKRGPRGTELRKRPSSSSATDSFDERDTVAVSDTLPAAKRARRVERSPARLGRFNLVRKLGEGGMGQVYEARDSNSEQHVALKRLFDVDPASVYKLKREFRGMANIAHYNLVSLYELFVEDGACFFSMEYVPGGDFCEALRPSLKSGYGRLRDALRQLTHGVHALHEMGRIHRDLKPHNVIVTEDNRVVVLDFGLASEVDRQTLFTSTRGLVQGTPAYMAPEQAAGQLATPATDWYAVGVILYESLTGRLPIEGSVMEMLVNKQYDDPTPVSSLRANVDAGLDRLVSELLHRDPERRPDASRILAWCAESGARTTLPRVAMRRVAEVNLLGREEQLLQLNEAYNEVVAGRSACVDVRGEAGTGKTALVRGFLKPLRERSDVVVFEGACSDRESVPFRAFDGLVDGIAAHFHHMSPGHKRALTRGLSDEIAALCQIFPVLHRAGLGSDDTAAGAVESPDTRRRAFAGLKALLFRLGQRSTLILVIDDLHRGDMDSARLLGELLAPPNLPSLLLISTYDPSAVRDSQIVRDLELLRAMVTVKYSLRVIETGPLAPDKATALALHYLGEGRSSRAVKRARAIAVEAAGNPMLIEALSQEVGRTDSPLVAADGVTLTIARGSLLRSLVQARLRGLHPNALDLLAQIVVARTSLDIEVLRHASESTGELPTLLSHLRGGRLLRITEQQGAVRIEAYHEQLRAAVEKLLGPDRVVDSHYNLARALIATKKGEPDVIAFHLSEAGEFDDAAEYAAEAAYASLQALAFDRAAELYQLAIQCSPRVWTYRKRCAEALVRAGRATEAAEMYLSASERAPERKQSALKLAAIDQFMLSGHIDRGISVAKPLCDNFGVNLPTDARTIGSQYTQFLQRLNRRGLRYREKSDLEIHRQTRDSLDLLWVVGRGVLLNEPIRGGYLLARMAIDALEAGEPKRIAKSLALVGIVASSHERGGGEEFVETARKIAEHTHDRYAQGLAAICRGIRARHAGEWMPALSDLEHGIASLQAISSEYSWETSLAQRSALAILESIGEIRALQHRTQRLYQQAQESGDIHMGLLAASYSALGLLATDQSREARTRMRGALAYWPRTGFQVQHLQGLKIEVMCDLYDGYAEDAWQRVVNEWPRIEQSNFLRLSTRRAEALALRARATLAAINSNPRRHGRLLNVVEQDIRQLEREQLESQRASAALLRAAMLAVYRERDEVVRYLGAAISGFEAAGMMLMAACARWCKGQWTGDASQLKQAEAFIMMQSVLVPEKWISVFAPGLTSGGA